ncbi:MAG: LysR family transcriptional regulator [Bacteroidetes bacterium 24-39-8]|jgi:DNA-binding transcriptional LysR family regulator|nr:MAG: LysR family transcriptional regulator [Sphingobacteriia bacterium 35-40-8]OYZ51744.1 MAG: LysR family transcriptional regulator [Bacteroidetes bacterium 24-39-8]HQS55209.1 LysR family transcriptional regulator [Sediminibacterium sp.]
MNYSLHQLAIFLKVTQTKSITRTAEEMHLTQPAVSIQLKNFQNQFDLALIEIINKRVYITDFGMEIAQCAENILNEAKSIDYRLMQYKGSLTGTLKISCVSTGKYVVPYFLSKFLKTNDGVELRLNVSNKSRVVETLEKNETDFAMVSVLPNHLQLNSISLMPNTLFLVGPGDHPYKKEPMNKSLLETLPLIYREEGSATRMAMEKFIENKRIMVRKKIQLSSNEAVKQAVLAGIGYSIMPIIGLKNELVNKQLQIIPTKGLPLKTTWNLVWLKDKKLSPVAKAFIQELALEKQSIIQEKFSWINQF